MIFLPKVNAKKSIEMLCIGVALCVGNGFFSSEINASNARDLSNCEYACDEAYAQCVSICWQKFQSSSKARDCVTSVNDT